jgi:transcription initiation protein SPT3
LNTTAYLDLKPNEDVMDVLGFLAFESVRSLCVAALEIRDAAAGVKRVDEMNLPPLTKDEIAQGGEDAGAGPMQVGDDTEEKRETGTDGYGDVGETEKLLLSPSQQQAQGSLSQGQKKPVLEQWKAPTTLPLLPAHLLTAYARLQRAQAEKNGGGLRNWRGGVKRQKIALI